jgi:hypothetical protein
MCLVLDFGFRVWVGLGLARFRLRFSVDLDRSLVLRLASCQIALVALAGVASSYRLWFELG